MISSRDLFLEERCKEAAQEFSQNRLDYDRKTLYMEDKQSLTLIASSTEYSNVVLIQKAV